MRHVTFLLVLVMLVGCKASKPALINPSPESNPNTTENANSPEEMGHSEVLGMRTVRGKLYHTKGKMGEVGGMIISGEYLCDPATKAWLPAYEKLVGKEVEVRGEHYRYVCSPIEQCLEGGVINYLQKIEYLKAAD